MDQQDMKAEWRCITMGNGVLCVIMTGTRMMHKLYVVNGDLVKKLMLSILHTMDRVVVLFG